VQSVARGVCRKWIKKRNWAWGTRTGPVYWVLGRVENEMISAVRWIRQLISDQGSGHQGPLDFDRGAWEARVHGRTMHPRALDNVSLYKGCEREIPHFSIVFLSLLFLNEKRSFLLSPFSSSSSMEKTAAAGSPTRWSTETKGRRRRVGATKLLFFLKFFSVPTLFLTLFLFSP